MNFTDVFIETITPLVIDFIAGLVGILFALLLTKLRKVAALKNLTGALDALQGAVVETVYANQQALVDDLKEAAADHKLTKEEIAMLNARTIERSKAKVGPALVNVIVAAGIDIDNLILDTADGVVREIKAKG